MGVINLLDKETSVRIAAGEVVENAASVIKELIENSIDAGAKKITVEIKEGGKSYIRVTDDGAGMAYDDALLCFERHATSKIRTAADIAGVYTMGFRGEALAAVASVAKVTLYTKRKEDKLGTETVVEGGAVRKHEESGQKDGTTMIVKDLFYNTPARKKFLRRDATETLYVSQMVEREALARPDISFTFIKDGVEKFFTDGSGDLLSAVTSIYGRQLADTLIKVDSDNGGVVVRGYICRPTAARATRDMQLFYVNRRYIKNKTLAAAVENGYSNELMTRRFPVCILSIEVSPTETDVNVSPSKTEIKFSENVPVFDSVYFAVKATLAGGYDKERFVMPESEPKNDFEKLINSVASLVTEEKPPKESGWDVESKSRWDGKLGEVFHEEPTIGGKPLKEVVSGAPAPKAPENESFIKTPAVVSAPEEKAAPAADYVIIGELFKSYLVVEQGDELLIIDKHAAHERILFEKLKKEAAPPASQLLLVPETVELSAERAGALSAFEKRLESYGFYCKYKDGAAVISGMPAGIDRADAEEALCEALDILAGGKGSDNAVNDRIYHSVACRAAVKAGVPLPREDRENLVKMLMEMPDIRYCPHGRPVMTVLKKSDLDLRFKRI